MKRLLLLALILCLAAGDFKRSRPAPDPHIPSLPGVTLWLDASEDLTKITYDAQRRVGTWASRVGSISFTQATAGNKPVRTVGSGVDTTPLVHYKCEDNAASTTVADSQGNYNGTSTRNTSVFSTASGKVERGFDFYTGASDDDIDLGDDRISANGAYTFCGWIDVHGPGESFGRIVTNAADNENIYVASSAPNYYFSYNGTSLTDFSITLAQYDHYCFVRDTVFTAYKNGEMVATTAAGSGAAIRYIGNRAAADRAFDGRLDDIRIYDRALSPNEIGLIYSAGDGTQEIVHRGSPSGRSGVWFDGVGDVFSTSATLNDVYANSEKQFFIVFRANDVANDYGILSSTSGYWHLSIVGASTTLGHNNYDGSTDTASKTIVANKTYVASGWHTGGNICLDVNGGGATCTASGNTSVMTNPLWLGSASGGGSQWFNGDVEELILANKAWSSATRAKVRRYLCKKWGADC